METKSDVKTALYGDKEIKRQKAFTDIYLHTGSTLFDLLVGGGVSDPSSPIGLAMGFCGGRIYNIYGEANSGKTFFACETIVASKRKYKDKFKFIYDDAEEGYSFDAETLWGVDIEPTHSETIEELFVNIMDFLDGIKSDECGIYVVDSLDALSNKEIDERVNDRIKAAKKNESFDQGTYGMSTQKFLSQEFFRKISSRLNETNCTLIFLSQLRDNVNAGLFGQKRRKSGGSALDFYCNQIIGLSVKEKFMCKGRTVGVCVEAKNTKAKNDRPFRSCFVNILYEMGIDNISSNLDYVLDLKNEHGKLLSPTALNSIVIDGGEKTENYNKYKSDIKGLKSVMEEVGVYSDFKEYCRKNKLKANKKVILDWMLDDEERRTYYEEYYGTACSREELIKRFDSTKKTKRELVMKTIKKWEDFEASLKTGRKKYDEDSDEDELY